MKRTVTNNLVARSFLEPVSGSIEGEDDISRHANMQRDLMEISRALKVDDDLEVLSLIQPIANCMDNKASYPLKSFDWSRSGGIEAILQKTEGIGKNWWSREESRMRSIREVCDTNEMIMLP